ncbi:hypothetical protein [Halobellus sp. H-GB7]|uniref:hypothetical protein n=1 Tax=Halobellus sp. H-GB7 TaxID=3069756 RepID=UPI0027B703DA|nr:hypothetical protein [Halobellus sp. H-GB7]MDQ2053897.1 hypothetical protein [Halobellus sp. H-GB7]
MSTIDVPVGISWTKLLAVVVLATVLGGVGAGFVSTDIFDATTQPSPAPLGGDSASEVAGITVTATDPSNVRNEAGDAGVVAGALGGRLDLERDVSRVDFVVRSRLPNGTWVVVDRASVESIQSGTDAIDLATVVGGPNTTYLGQTQSDGFDVATPGSTARRDGAVAVTARLYADGQRVATVTDTDGYAFVVDRPAGRTVGGPNENTVTASGDGASTPNDQAETRSDSTGSAGGGAGGSDGGSETEDGAEANRTTALFGAQDVLPGSRGTSAAQLSNPRGESVTATFAVGGAVDDENGLTEPEATVDDTATQGELSDHLAVRIAITRESGGRSFLVGSTDGYVSLADAAETTRSLELDPNETVSVVVEWRVDAAVGNEIQSDRTTLSVHCTFEPSTTLLAAIA